MKKVDLLFPLLAGALALASGASAQSANFANFATQMRAECSAAGQAHFRNHAAWTDTRYDGQRGDGTHVIVGVIHLGSRTEEFACSYDRNATRMLRFFAEGRWRANPLTGAGTPPTPAGDPGTPLVRVTGVPANDVLSVRSGPGLQHDRVAVLRNGDVLARIGCQLVKNTTWCRVLKTSHLGTQGWVDARYLAPIKGSDKDTDKPKPPNLDGTGQTTTKILRFPPGSKSLELKERLPSKATRRYVLGARAWQTLQFALSTKAQQMTWRILAPNGRLIAQDGASREFRGQLRQTGEYVIEITNGGSRSHDFTVKFKID